MSFLMHLSRRLICTIMIRRCPSVVVNFHIFHSSSETTEQNSTKLDRKQDHNFLYLVCVSGGRSKNSMAALASNWQKHLKPLIGTQRNLTGSKIPTSSTKFFRANQKKQDGLLGLWLPETYWNSPLKPLNGIQWNLTGSKISMSSTKFEFELIGKARWPPWPLIRWDIFHFSSETAEQNSRKLDRNQDLNVLYCVGIIWADQKNSMAACVSDWLRHFRLLLWNRWMACNETWQEERSQRPLPLPSLCFLGRSEKQDGRPGKFVEKVAHCI